MTDNPDRADAILKGAADDQTFTDSFDIDEGLIARPDDRGDAVLHLAPPLISGPAELDEMVAKTEAVLADASERFFAG